jgi:septal ring factor EnvC (AmiA/AmiB activator)
MNKYYLLVPGAMLAGFIGYERYFQRDRDERERAQAAIVSTVRAEQEEKRQQQVELARQDTQERNAKREQAEQEKAAQKKRDYESLIATLQSQADEHATETARLNETIHEMATQVDAMRARQQALEREARELTRQLELKQIDLRNVELGVQETTSAVAARLGEAL